MHLTRLSILTVFMSFSLISTLDIKDFTYLKDALMEKQEEKSHTASLFDEWFQDILDLYDVLTVSDEYKRRIRENHEKGGAFRSGEGTEAEIYAKIQKIEERKILEKMIENHEFSDDPTVNKKLNELLQSKFKKMAVRNDDVDLVPVHKFETPHVAKP
jgi:hypothetical protein